MSITGELPESSPDWAKIINYNLTALHANIDSATNRLDDVENRVDENQQEIKTIRSTLTNLTEENQLLRQTVTNLALTTRRLQDKLLSLENYSRKENHLIHGVKENPDENIHADLIALFEKAGVDNPQSLMLAAYHRLGKAKKGAITPRPIMVRFVRRGDCDLVFQKYVSTRVDKFRVSQDLAERTLLRRNRLLTIYIDAKKKVGKEVKFVEDRLILKGKHIHWRHWTRSRIGCPPLLSRPSPTKRP